MLENNQMHFRRTIRVMDIIVSRRRLCKLRRSIPMSLYGARALLNRTRALQFNLDV
jgi:hypothetical protein